MNLNPLAFFMPGKIVESGQDLTFNRRSISACKDSRRSIFACRDSRRSIYACKDRPTFNRLLFVMILALVLLAGCASAPSTPLPTPTSLPSEPTLSDDEIATLSSLEQLDDFPLYTMRYVGAYSPPTLTANESLRPPETAGLVAQNACQPAWGCSLFATLGEPGERLYGRNFDWRFSPAVLLFTDPPDGYASVSMVDIEYLGFGGTQTGSLLDLPLNERRALLDTPSWPFDGMNEQGLAIGMAAVPPGEMRPDSDKKTTDQLGIMREILDHAATVDAAVDILGSYNIDMGSVPVHYLIASAAGDSALVEFYQGKMEVFRNEDPWQLATNFLVASVGGRTQGQCPRYDIISQRLQETGGRLSIQDALSLLADVSQGGPQAQSSTQWSVVYDMAGRDVNIVMGRKYTREVHTLHLSLSGQ